MLPIGIRHFLLPVIFMAIQGTVVSAQAQTSPKPDDEQIQIYNEELRAYRKAREGHEERAKEYWLKIKEYQAARRLKRSKNEKVVAADYVSEHPPEYTGLAAPRKPDILAKKEKDPTPAKQHPVVADFLAHAKKEYGFIPRSPKDEHEYMLAFAREALAVGLTPEQVVGVYALETGGIGPYSRQSGVFTTDQQCNPIPPRGKPAATLALGYVQLLPANTVLSAQKLVKNVTKRLKDMADVASSPNKSKELRAKAHTIQKMVDDVDRWVAAYGGDKNNWKEYVVYGRTDNGLAIHAILLDADVGPWLQAGKLLGITQYAKRKGLSNLKSAQLELINLVGDGRGIDALDPAAKDSSSANFFDPDGYEGNPVAKNRSALGLVERLNEIIDLRRKECGSKWFEKAFDKATKGGR